MSDGLGMGEAMSAEREAVVKILKLEEGRPVSIKAMALELGKPYDRAKVLCWRMATAGQILNPSKGMYSYNPRTSITTETKEIAVTAETVETKETETVSRFPRLQGLGV